MTTLEKIAVAVTGIEFIGALALAKVLKVGADEMAKKQGYENAKDYLNKVTKRN